MGVTPATGAKKTPNTGERPDLALVVLTLLGRVLITARRRSNLVENTLYELRQIRPGRAGAL